MTRLLAVSIVGLLVAGTGLGVPPAAPALARAADAPTARIIRVPSEGDLQAALDAALPGTYIELPAGAIFTGNFVLPNKSGTDWIVIYSSAFWHLPSPGTFLSPASAEFMPKIVSPNTLPAIRVAAGAHHYQFIGIEVTTTSPSLLDLVYLDFAGQAAEQIPTDIILYRCYIHGNPTGDIRRGVALNGARLAVIGSYLSDFHDRVEDAQAIMGWNGPGPFRIVGNVLEGAAENVIFGGGKTTIPGVVPSDIEIRSNYFRKPLSWREDDPTYAGIPWVVKNLLEFKNARRVLVEGNLFENNWPQTQHGFAIVLTPRNQDGTEPWSVVSDVTIRNNIIRHSTGGAYILGWDDLSHDSQQLQRVLIQNNLWEDIGTFPGLLPNAGVLFLIADGPADLSIDHNTALATSNPIKATSVDMTIDRWPATGFVFTNTIVLNNEGVTDASGRPPLEILSTYFPGAIFARDVLVGGDREAYPPDNFFPATLDAVGFVDLAGGNYRLAPTSPYVGMGTDGQDIGVDLDALQAALLRWR